MYTIKSQEVTKNSDYVFHDNCFSTQVFDAHFQGSFNPIITGGISRAANNCFTHSGNTNSNVTDIAGSSIFTYLEPADNENDCLDVFNDNIFVTNDFMPELPCGYSGSNFTSPGTTNKFNLCRPFRTNEATEEAINQILKTILEIENNPDLTEQQKIWIISFYKRCLTKITRTRFEILIEERKFDQARKLFENEESNDAKILIYTSYVYENKFSEARNYLNLLMNQNDDLTDFVSV